MSASTWRERSTAPAFAASHCSTPALGRDSGGKVSYLVDEGGEVLNAVTFIIFGAAILGPALDDLGWEILVYAYSA